MASLVVPIIAIIIIMSRLVVVIPLKLMAVSGLFVVTCLFPVMIIVNFLLLTLMALTLTRISILTLLLAPTLKVRLAWVMAPSTLSIGVSMVALLAALGMMFMFLFSVWEVNIGLLAVLRPISWLVIGDKTVPELRV